MVMTGATLGIAEIGIGTVGVAASGAVIAATIVVWLGTIVGGVSSCWRFRVSTSFF